MLNQIVLVGRLVKEVELEKDVEKDIARITIAVPRSYKNEEGIYDTDFIDCTLIGGIAQNSSEYCKKGDLIGIKGRVQSTEIEKEDGTKTRTMDIIAEKVTFLSSRKEDE